MTRTLTELHSTSAEPFYDYESFLQELSDTDSMMINGGKNNNYSNQSNYEKKLLEYELVKCAISCTISLCKLLIDIPQYRSQNCISSEKLEIERFLKQCYFP